MGDIIAPVRICANCGNNIDFGQRNRMYCSNRCKKAAFNSRNREKINENARIYRRSEAGKASRKKYRDRLREERLTIRAAVKRVKEESSVWRHESRQCPTCGCVFAPSYSVAVYCSRTCKNNRTRYRARSDNDRERDAEYRRKNLAEIREKDRERNRLRKLKDPVKFRADARARERWRYARKNLATIIMPIEKR